MSMSTSISHVAFFFSTDWCGYCPSAKRAWKKAVAELPVVTEVVDGELREDLVKRFKVGGFPTVVLVPATNRNFKPATAPWVVRCKARVTGVIRIRGARGVTDYADELLKVLP